MKLLITGASGLFGSKLAEIAAARDYQVYSGYGRNRVTSGIPIQFDVSNKNRVKDVFKKINPEVVVHAAALTDVDKCELNRKLAWRINVEGARNIAEAVKSLNTFLIYISTDYVFNGETGLYSENDKTNPINFYGITKLRAENLVKELVNNYCIVRTSVIYGAIAATGKINFALWLLHQLKKEKQLKIVADQWNSPTLNKNLAEMALEVIERNLTGTFHLSGATRISRFDFAKLLAQTFELDENLINPRSVEDSSWVAKRPKDSSLDTAKAQQTLENKPLQIKQALRMLRLELE